MLKLFDPGRLLVIDPAWTATKVSPEVTVEGVHRGDMLETCVIGFSSVFFAFRFALGWILVSSIRILWYLEEEAKVTHAVFL